MAQKAANYGPEIMRLAERSLLLQLLDQIWKDHLLSLDHLRQGINLRAYAQRDPLNEYKREAFELFQRMLDHLREQVTSVMGHVELRVERPAQEAVPPPPPSPRMIETREDPAGPAGPEGLNGQGGVAVATAAAAASPWARTPRNAACPCGSGKKFKHCHGRA
jgi:preprotein translocase subunit SecA